MFSTIESTWDQHARRGWSALASFGFQAMALSLLLLVPLFTIQGPSTWAWLQHPTAPPILTPLVPEEVVHEHYRAGTVSNMYGGHLLQPQRIPRGTTHIDDGELGPPAPDVPGVEFRPGARDGVPYGLGSNFPVVIPNHVTEPKPLIVSHMNEGNLLLRVQPVYPPLARAAGIQGPVQLRAIISRTGTIEHLTVESGPAMLIRAAADAVQQWRYRPYLLNGEPIEVETEITVNFVLAGG